jgi:hypothetical protein
MLFKWTIFDTNDNLKKEHDTLNDKPKPKDIGSPKKKNRLDILHYVVNKMLLNAKFRTKFIKSILNLLSRSTKILKLRLDNFSCTVGWDDPAEVGLFYGFAQLIVFHIRTLQMIECEITPSFSEVRFDFDVKGTVRLYPGRVFWVAALFLVEFPVLAVVRLIRYVRRVDGKK